MSRTMQAGCAIICPGPSLKTSMVRCLRNDYPIWIIINDAHRLMHPESGLRIWSCCDDYAFKTMRPTWCPDAILTAPHVAAEIRRGEHADIPSCIPIWTKKDAASGIPQPIRRKYSISFALALSSRLGAQSVHYYGCDMSGASYATSRFRSANLEEDNEGMTRWDKELRDFEQMVHYLTTFRGMTITRGRDQHGRRIE